MEAQYLVDHLDQYKSAVLGKGANKVHILPMPPRMNSVGVRPIMLDVASPPLKSSVVAPVTRSFGAGSGFLEYSRDLESVPEGGSNVALWTLGS